MNATKTGALVVYACLIAFIEENSWPPTLTELAELSNYSRGGVSRYLDWLELHSYIERDENHSTRCIRVVKS